MSCSREPGWAGDCATCCASSGLASRGRRSGVILPGGGGGQDSDTILLESVKAAPRRSSIIKVPKQSPSLTAALENHELHF
uniref:Uncharacterized protein n=1 Tax=Cyprinodon variegatus TaxID=28743 RepID=A0A3Q2CCA7_CYPVA